MHMGLRVGVAAVGLAPALPASGPAEGQTDDSQSERIGGRWDLTGDPLPGDVSGELRGG